MGVLMVTHLQELLELMGDVLEMFDCDVESQILSLETLYCLLQTTWPR